LIGVGRFENLTVGNNDYPTDRDSLERLAIAECDIVTAVTHKATQCEVIIPREWIALDCSTQHTKYRDDRSSGECDK
jgi:hypothetical protein